MPTCTIGKGLITQSSKLRIPEDNKTKIIRNFLKEFVSLQKELNITIMAALNIQIDIPNMGVYELEELKHKVTLFAKKLATVSRKSEAKDAK